MDVEIEDQTTWPAEILEELREQKDVLLAYHRENRRIELQGRNNVAYRINPEKNKHKAAYMRLANHIEGLLEQHRIMAYHCTRLTPGEIVEIKTNGMKRLTANLIQNKLNRCLVDGYISVEELKLLNQDTSIKNNLSNQNGLRTGMIWFCPNRSTLLDHGSVYRLFRSWGGEAVYNGQENDPTFSNLLSRIGTPCIIKCVIPFAKIKVTTPNLGQRFISQFVLIEIEYPEPPPNFDLHIEEDISPSDVIEIIEHNNPQFADLTNNGENADA